MYLRCWLCTCQLSPQTCFTDLSPVTNNAPTRDTVTVVATAHSLLETGNSITACVTGTLIVIVVFQNLSSLNNRNTHNDVKAVHLEHCLLDMVVPAEQGYEIAPQGARSPASSQRACHCCSSRDTLCTVSMRWGSISMLRYMSLRNTKRSHPRHNCHSMLSGVQHQV
jgi:hypothetical protein